MYLYSYHSAEELGPPSANATVSASSVRVSAYAYETAKSFFSGEGETNWIYGFESGFSSFLRTPYPPYAMLPLTILASRSLGVLVLFYLK